jgi:hypothetical protein
MRTSFRRGTLSKGFNGLPNHWARIALASALALACLSAGGANPAFATGAAAYVTIYDASANENAGDFYASDPAAWIPGGTNLLVPEADIYTSGASTTAATSLFRSPIGGSGLGTAAADLYLGTLSAYATSTGNATTLSTAGFSDTITPLATGIAHWDIAVTGSTAGAGGALGGAWFAIDDSVFLGTRGEVLADAPECFSPGATTNCIYAFDIPVEAGVPYRFSAALQAGASDATLDLSDTATFRLTGVAFTSESGVFLTAVPEPGSLLLMGFGLAALSRGRKQAA